MTNHDPLTTELWAIYDEYRAACLSRKYYGRRFKWFRRISVSLDLIVAASTTLAATQLLKGGHQEILQWFAAASALAALAKSTYAISKDVDRYAHLYKGYNELTDKYRRLCTDIKIAKAVDASARKRAKDLAEKMDALSSQEDPDHDSGRLEKLKAEVEREIPTTWFYWPACEPAPARPAAVPPPDKASPVESKG